MPENPDRIVAIVGVGAVLPDAKDAPTFWNNVKQGRYSVRDVPEGRWDPDLYWDPDPKAPDKTYSKIGGWVTDWAWEPLQWRLPIPPKVSDAMDRTQKWAILCAREALQDYGYPQRPLDPERTAVILGNAMAGDLHYRTSMRISYPEIERELTAASSFQALAPSVREALAGELRQRVLDLLPPITEDTMPGELANIIAGRVANLFDLHGPNFVVDAACASAMAAITAAIEGLAGRDFDAVITGGIDANMSAATFTKFCKIGALSATGTRPFADGADGFVMGEGGAVFILKRLEDAERDGDEIYALIRGLGGSSDGRGKGITAPNPVGQRLAVERAWKSAGLRPDPGTLVEGHGTSTRVGDVVEVESLSEVFGHYGASQGSIPLGSVKSNIGHLKGAAGAAGILKAALSLKHKVLPPSLGFERPNPNIDFSRCPFYVNTALRPWQIDGAESRTVGVSAFGFGGTNFHAVLEEHIPGRYADRARAKVAAGATPRASVAAAVTMDSRPVRLKPPLRGALVLGAESEAGIVEQLREVEARAASGDVPAPRPPRASDLSSPFRLAIDYEDGAGLAKKAGKAIKALTTGREGMWRPLNAQGVYRGRGPAAKVAFLYTGQGSQYLNMLRELRDLEPVVAETIAEADEVMTPFLGRPLSEFVFVDTDDAERVSAAEKELQQTAITQPAVLTTDIALTRLLRSYGVVPDMVMGHSLGEYGALVASGALSFGAALEAVSARGNEMTRLSVDDSGWMAAVFAPLEEIEAIVAGIEGYVVVANINSFSQSVIGGETTAVQQAIEALREAGYQAQRLPVSHAFHTRIVSPSSEPLKVVLRRLGLQPPSLPIVANVSGDFYPMGPGVLPEMIEILARQVAEPVQFVKGLQTLYGAGARVFVEVGPKRALHGMARDVLGRNGDISALFTNHPRSGEVGSFNNALCGLFAAGLGFGTDPEDGAEAEPIRPPVAVTATASPVPAVTPPPAMPAPDAAPVAAPAPSAAGAGSRRLDDEGYRELGEMFAEFLDRGFEVYSRRTSPPPPLPKPAAPAAPERPVVISGAALGLPGVESVFDDANISRILRGDQFIRPVPAEIRQAMVDKNITRLVKTEVGEPRFESIDSTDEVIRLAARKGRLDLVEEFGFPADRLPALDVVTELAIGAGLDAMRDAGIPLTMRYKTTTKGTQLPERWGLPDELRDDTGVIFASAFPGINYFAAETERFYRHRARLERLADLEGLQQRISSGNGESGVALGELEALMSEIAGEMEREPYTFDRRFLFKLLSMGHAQFAELIYARGPNTQVNAACASTTQAVGLAEDWIRQGRCRRVVVISADDVTSDDLLGWIGAGFLATGAAATDERVEDAAIPFDRRRHGMLVGMGAAAIVIESPEAVEERGLRPICEVLGAEIANSAYHGTRLDVSHITGVMEDLVSRAERRWGIDRREIARETVFISHETYTPARGGSAQAEIYALRDVFREDADEIVISNTKGYTGHPMAVGIEDVLAVKTLETGLVPPVANFKEVDPDLGNLNLSRGGALPVRYALRLGAGFGSQISLSLMRRSETPDGRRPGPDELGYAYRVEDPERWRGWLSRISGYPEAETEVERRTLRIKDQGPPVKRQSEAPVVDAPVPAVPAPEPVAAPAPAARSPEAPSTDPVRERVLEIVAEMTGYPPEMLDPELDMEADLGIDTVKQAETFAAIREEWGIERDDALQLRDFPTLGHTIQFVYDRRPDLTRPEAGTVEAPPPAAPAAAAAPEAGIGAGDAVARRVLEIVAEMTGYPPEMLDPELDMEADLGIDTVKQAETFAAIREEWGIERDDALQLRDFPTLGHTIQFVYDRRPDLTRPEAGAVEAPPPAAPAAAAAPGAGIGAGDAVARRVLEIVAEMTGYPPEMLDPELDMEADLGIDTVKQAETFAAIREEWGIERDDELQLRDFPTLGHTIQFVYDRRPDLAPGATAAAPAASPETTPAEAAGATAPTSEPVRDRVLEIVAEMTGYPPEMLDLDLDMEADLGIDTVKQAETFAAIRGEWGIERDDELQLRDFPTLGHTIQFVYDRRPDLVPGAAPAEAPAVEVSGGAALAPSRTSVESVPEAASEIPRRGPEAVLRPPLELCKPTGVVLDERSRVVVVADRGGVGKALRTRLEKRGVEVLWLDDAPDAAELVARLEEWLGSGAIQGVYWLPALDPEGPIDELEPEAWREAVRRRVKLLYATSRALYEQLGSDGAFLISATRLGGRHGYDDHGAQAPLGGAVSGLTKTLARERPEALIKVVDFAAMRKTAMPADALLAETETDPGAVEIGYADGHRWTVALAGRETSDARPDVPPGRDSIWVVTGAAGSIVSAIVADLAGAWGGTWYLLDLAPAPDPADPELEMFVRDRDGLKRRIFERLKSAGERATPAMVEKELAGLERRQAALSAVEAVRAGGGEAHYRSLDLRDGEAVTAVMDEIRERHGSVDCLIHAAGLEISHMLPDKSPEEFDLVFDVKADGFYQLLRGARGMRLERTVVFGSIAGRFGNAGQADYSAANDLLCKLSSSFRSTRPETRALAVDWTAWGGIGMATRGSIPKMMQVAGIDMLPPEAGIAFVRRELAAGTSDELVAAQRLGVMLEERDPTGGLEVGSVAQPKAGPMTGRVVGMGVDQGLVVEALLDPSAQPFLFDHQIDGTAVLPGVMGIEAFAEAARVCFPGLAVEAVEHVEFLTPFKFYRGEPRTVRVEASFRLAGESVVARCRLLGSRRLAGRSEPTVTVHFTADVRLGREPSEPLPRSRPDGPGGPTVGREEIYKLYFHGPAYQVLERAWRDDGKAVGALPEDLPSNHLPEEAPILMAPRLIELCFQTAGLWEMGVHGRMGLPRRLERVRLFKQPARGDGPLLAVVEPNEGAATYDAWVLDETGEVVLELGGYGTVELPGALSEENLERVRNALG